MRIRNRVFLTALFVCLATGGINATQEEVKWATEVKQAVNPILSNSPKPAEVDRSLTRLCDIAVRIAARDTRVQPEFREKLKAAAQALAGNPLGAESGAALNEAYKLINGGKSYAFPAEVQDMNDATRIARQHIERSAKLLESGESQQALREILAFILLVTTPIMR